MSMSLLIITKSKFFEEALKLILSDTDGKIEAVSSKEDLIGRLKERDYEAIICDMSCAKRDIEAVYEKIREIKPNIKVIVFSFDPPNKHRGFIRSVGADGYINRPLDPDTVLDAMNSLLNKS